MKIAVVGVGGVGGYYGGLLSERYRPDSDVEITFIARGGHLAAIRESGLRLARVEGELTVWPDQVTDAPAGGDHLRRRSFLCQELRPGAKRRNRRRRSGPRDGGADTAERRGQRRPAAVGSAASNGS